MQRINEWFYIIKGQKYGPETMEYLFELYNEGFINNKTKVWKKGLPDWIEFGQANVTGQEIILLPTKVKDVDNALIWIIALSPIFYAILDITASMIKGEYYKLLFPYIANIILCLWDEERLKRSGYKTGYMASWAYILMPMYIFKRAELVKSKYVYAIVLCLSIAFLYFIKVLVYNIKI